MRHKLERSGLRQWRRVCLCAIACLAGTAQAAGVYKWVDRNGIVRYDDHSLLAERLTRASIARGAVAADAKATVPAEFVEEVAKQCSDLKERSDSYAGAREIFGRDPSGNVYRFSDRQQALEVAYLQQDTYRYCRPLAAQYLLMEARAEIRAAEQQALKSATTDR